MSNALKSTASPPSERESMKKAKMNPNSNEQILSDLDDIQNEIQNIEYTISDKSGQ